MKFLLILSTLLLNSCLDLYRSPSIYRSLNIYRSPNIDLNSLSSHKKVMQAYSPAVIAALKPWFLLAGVAFPPKKLAYIAIKDEKILEVWAKNKASDNYKYITAFPVLGQSGTLGHKLKQGDMQVPEGVYSLVSLKPDSKYHLGIKIGYPNQIDKYYAAHDGRTRLGGDIYLHGVLQSTGCLSMGNRVIEQLYVLTALTGLKNSKILITPTDFRKNKVLKNMNQPAWQDDFYKNIEQNMTKVSHFNNKRPLPPVPYKRFTVYGATGTIYNPNVIQVVPKSYINPITPMLHPHKGL